MDRSPSEYRTDTDIRFTSADAWRACVRPPPARICQPPGTRGFPYTERHLQCIWFDDRLRPATLTTRDGETVTVLSPGRWNLEAGPDFLDAEIILGPDARHLRGDVEVHIQPADWDRHGHAADPRYRRVVAHLTFGPASTSPRGLPAGTAEIALRDALAALPAFSMEAVDISAYPYAAANADPCPCAGILRGWTPEQRGAMLETAGAFRIEQKASRFALHLRRTDADTLMYRETMAALGYKHNSLPFRTLADRVPEALLRQRAPHDAYALLLGVAGLLPETPSPRWSRETRDLIRQVWDAWWPLQARWTPARLPQDAWTLAALRPQNHPLRRLAAAATLFAHPEPLSVRLRHAVASGRPEAMAALAEPPPPLDYWLHHLGLGTPRLESGVTLLGRGRLAAWSANVILPLLAAEGTDITPLLHVLPPEQTNSVMRQTAHRLFGRDHNPALYTRNGLRQQGLMQIFHDVCLAERTGCAHCPFPAAAAAHMAHGPGTGAPPATVNDPHSTGS